FVVFVSYRLPPRLPSFPTRRSSDLRRAVSEPEDSLRAGGGEFRFLLAQAWLEAPAGPHRAAVPAAHSAGTGPRRLHDRTRDPHRDRKSTRLNSSHVKISYAVLCLKK